MFHVGQKVVCVDDSQGALNNVCGYVKGQCYTIIAVHGVDGVKTKEFGPFTEHNWVYARRFRPIQTTSIEIFQAMLVPTPKEKVEA